jgi:FixJ family two-component response regulator
VGRDLPGAGTRLVIPQGHAMSARPGQVIVVDDDAAVRNSLKFALELEGLAVRVYDGGDALLAEPDLPEVGCLVVDYYMPSMDGVELIERLRGRRVDLPAILITAKATRDMRERAARCGFSRVLEKPLEDGALVDSIRFALSLR